MTKSQWKALRTGDKVKMDSFTYSQINGELQAKKVTIQGEVIRFNLGCSQVEVDFNGSKTWKGRLGIEIVSKNEL